MQEQRACARDKDGIFLENVDGFQLSFLIHWLQKKANPKYILRKTYPKDLCQLLELIKVADYYGISFVKEEICEEICGNYHFQRYQNVRRLVFDFLGEDQTIALLACGVIPLQVLIYCLLDPTIQFKDPMDEETVITLNANLFSEIFLPKYREYTINWLDLTECRSD